MSESHEGNVNERKGKMHRQCREGENASCMLKSEEEEKLLFSCKEEEGLSCKKVKRRERGGNPDVLQMQRA